MNILRHALIRAAVAGGVPQEELVNAHTELEKAMYPISPQAADILVYWSAARVMAISTLKPVRAKGGGGKTA